MKSVNIVSQVLKYGDTTAFSDGTDRFETLLELLGCEILRQDGNDNDFEIDVDEYDNAFEILSVYKTYGNGNEFEEIQHDLEVDEIDYTELDFILSHLGGIDYVMKKMKSFREEADTSNGTLIFCCF